MLRWLRRRQQAERLALADAEALIRDHGAGAYGEARQRQQDAHNAETFAHSGRVIRTVARLIGRRIGLDTATRMAMDADFSERAERSTPECEPAPIVDPIEDLMRIVGEQATDAPPRPPKALFPDRRRSPKGRR